VNPTLKIQKSEAMTLIETIKAEIKKRSEAKAKRKLLKHPEEPRNATAEELKAAGDCSRHARELLRLRQPDFDRRSD
jgi:hypothetical protein